jgi:hypothetical protein
VIVNDDREGLVMDKKRERSNNEREREEKEKR